jgi:hypothetical protein
MLEADTHYPSVTVRERRDLCGDEAASLAPCKAIDVAGATIVDLAGAREECPMRVKPI